MSIQLIDIADVKAFLEISDTSFDSLLTSMVQDISQRMENYLNRTLKEDTYTEYFEVGRRNYWVKAYPISTVSSVVVDSTTQVEDTDFFVRENEGLIEFLNKTSGTKPKKVVITYTGGYTETSSVLAVPDDLKRACVLQTAYEFRRRKDIGLSSISMPDGSTSKFTDNEWLQILKWYRRIPTEF
jgi:uncharacterized phiE125 gp8 family phage protein